jgi:tripartite-type tricarboxylate transporter receptor subunit TctC
MKFPARQFLHAVAGVAVLMFSSSALAQDWPARPVTIVVGTAAGGGADVLARIIANRLRS